MAILITGGCGFIGINLARYFITKGETVVLFDIKPADILPRDLRESAKYIQGDISNWPEVINAVKENSIKDIFHLAGLLSAPSEANPWRCYNVNADGSFHVLEAARLYSVNKVIFC